MIPDKLETYRFIIFLKSSICCPDVDSGEFYAKTGRRRFACPIKQCLAKTSPSVLAVHYNSV